METTIVTPPTIKPVSTEDAKTHLRIDWTDIDNDSYIDGLIDTATDDIEKYLARRLITQTWKCFLSDWPGDDFITLPFGQLSSVTHIKYTDEDGDQSTLSASNYIVDTDSDPGRVVLVYDESWPTDTLYPSNPIEIQFVCGYGTSAADVPGRIRHAVKSVISDLFENREPALQETFVGKNLRQYMIY